MRRLQYAAMSLASILSLTFLGSCSKDTEYIDRIITETDTLYIEKTDTVYPATDTTLCIGQGVIEPTGGKVPLTIMIYGTGGGNLDLGINIGFYKAMQHFYSQEYYSDENSVLLGKNVNIVGQFKLSAPGNLMFFSYLSSLDMSTETAEALGGNAYRVIFNTNGYAEYDNYGSTANGFYSTIYKYSDIVGDSSYEMNSAEHLKEFINYTVEKAPAERYILVLENHGSGYYFDNNITRAVLYDDNLDGTTMSMPQIYNGIVESSIGHVDAIIFNTCLENNLEELCELVGAADYSVAESHVAVDAYNWLASLAYYDYRFANGQLSSFEEVLDLYAKATYAEVEASTISSSENYPHDICVTRLDELQKVGAALADFSKFLIEKQKEEDSLGVSILNINVINQCYKYFESENFFDVVDLVSLAYENYPTEMATIWDNFVEAVMAARVSCYNNSETWSSKSNALTKAETDYDTSWSIYLNSKEKFLSEYTEDEMDYLYGMLKFRRYSTTADGQYSWYTWLLTNNVEPVGNPTGYQSSVRDAWAERMLTYYESLANQNSGK